MKRRILFVCHGNICRSPMAEFRMKALVEEEAVSGRYEIASAATTTDEIGNPVYPPARRELASHGIGCEGKTARQMTWSDYGYYDMIVAMDHENLYGLETITHGDPAGKVSLLMEHVDCHHPRHGKDVADPWYTRDFGATWRDVDDGCRALLKELMD